MADVLIRDLDEKVLRILKKRAARNKRSLQGEVQFILEQTAQHEVDVVKGRALMERIRRELSGRHHSDSTELIAEDRRR